MKVLADILSFRRPLSRKVEVIATAKPSRGDDISFWDTVCVGPRHGVVVITDSAVDVQDSEIRIVKPYTRIRWNAGLPLRKSSGVIACVL